MLHGYIDQHRLQNYEQCQMLTSPCNGLTKVDCRNKSSQIKLAVLHAVKSEK